MCVCSQGERDGPRPRLCHMKKGSGGYGFNLHSEKNKPGQFIRAVDDDSPAQRAGLRPQDKIIQVCLALVVREFYRVCAACVSAVILLHEWRNGKSHFKQMESVWDTYFISPDYITDRFHIISQRWILTLQPYIQDSCANSEEFADYCVQAGSLLPVECSVPPAGVHSPCGSGWDWRFDHIFPPPTSLPLEFLSPLSVWILDSS